MSVIVLLAGLNIQCANKPKSTEPQPLPVEIPEGIQPPQVSPLTNNGENSQGRFTPDGSKILFISQGRSHHPNPQIYEYTLSNHKERRLTYHDGEAQAPDSHPNGRWLVYASTTDEIKERPIFIHQALNKLNVSQGKAPLVEPSPSTEIYLSRIDGNEIRRLTQFAGLDASPRFSRSGDRVYFVSQRGRFKHLYSIDPFANLRGPLFATQADDDLPTPGTKGGLAWVRRGNVSGDGRVLEQIWLLPSPQHLAQKILEVQGTINSMDWDTNNAYLVFSANTPDPANDELYAFNIEGHCLTRLTFEPAKDYQPAFAPDMKSLIFTSNRSGSEQIYQMPWTPPGPCSPP